MRNFGIPSQPDPEWEWDIAAMKFALKIAAPGLAISGLMLLLLGIQS